MKFDIVKMLTLIDPTLKIRRAVVKAKYETEI